MDRFMEQMERPEGHHDLERFTRERPISVNCDIFRDIGPVLKNLLENNQLCDGIVITEDGKQFNVHCTMLSAVSPYFRSSFTVIQPDPVRKIFVSRITSDIMAIILDFAYTGKLAVTSENVEKLMLAANEVEIPEIFRLCVNFLARELREENSVSIYAFSKEHKATDLEKICRKFFLTNFNKIFPSNSELLSLSASDMENLLRDDELNVKSEETVFFAAVRWTEEMYAERKCYLPILLGCVRFGLCSPEFYSNVVSRHHLIIDNQDCQAPLYAASLVYMEMQGHPDIRPIDMHHPLLRPRVPHEMIFAIGGWSTGSATNVMETYDNRSNRWFLSVYSDNMPRAYHGLISQNGLIYMIGGFDGNQCFNTMRCFDPVLHTWREKACMYTARCYVSVASLDGFVYALGGYDGHIRVSTGERYDPTQNQWHKIANMHQIRSDASASALSGKVYIAGGFNGQQVLNSAEMYDPNANSWTEIRPMSSPRSGVNLISFNDSLFVIGGFNGTNRLASVERYDRRHDTWLPIAPMISPRSNFATATIEDGLYVIGGFNGLTTVSNVECYDIRRNAWTSITGMNLNRSALSACVLKGLPNAKDYSFLGSATNSN